MENGKTTFVSIVRPDFRTRDNHGNVMVPQLADYITVPRLSTHGTWRVVDLLEMSTLAQLSGLHDRLSGVVRRGKRVK